MDDDSVSGISTYQNGLGIDNKLKQTAGSTASYFLADHLGSTNTLTDASGGIVASNSYDSFGNAANTGFPSRYQFTGREFDSFTGLQYNRARWYDATIGRFISEDPIGFAGGDINLYGYVRSKPLMFRDSRGLYPGDEVLSDPNALQALAAAASALGGYAAIAAPPIAVAGAGFGIGYAIGYYPGQLTARYFYPDQFPDTQTSPPFPNQSESIPRLTSPTAKPAPNCQPRSQPIPFYRSPSIPWDDDPDDENKRDCDIQLAADESVCHGIAEPEMPAACYKHAFDRWSSCRAGRNIPYNPWPDYPWD